nr:AMP-binding protein [Streptomyces sp. NBRC 110611]
MRSDRLVPGYFRRPDTTSEVFDKDGFYRMGDIMARVGPGELRYVDRRSNVLKLSQGESVAVSRLEALFNGSPVVGRPSCTATAPAPTCSRSSCRRRTPSTASTGMPGASSRSCGSPCRNSPPRQG